jgi:hypothetical protein
MVTGGITQSKFYYIYENGSMSTEYNLRDARNLPITTVCIKELKLKTKKGESILYALGSTTCYVLEDEPNEETGKYIAQQRADKAIQWLRESEFSLRKYDFKRKYKHLKGIRNDRIQILIDGELNNLEENLMGLVRLRPTDPIEDLENRCGIDVQVEKEE